MGEARTFLGESPDERRSRRRAVLVEAALDLVFAGGLPAVGVRSVSHKANLSTRYFYESFSGVNDLLIQMLREIFVAIMTPGIAALHSYDHNRTTILTDDEIYNLFCDALRIALAVVLGDPRKVALIAAANASNGEVRQEFKRMVALLVEFIEKDPAAKDLGVDHLAASFISAGVVESMVAFVAGELSMDNEALVKRLALMTLRVLKAT